MQTQKHTNPEKEEIVLPDYLNIEQFEYSPAATMDFRVNLFCQLSMHLPRTFLQFSLDNSVFFSFSMWNDPTILLKELAMLHQWLPLPRIRNARPSYSCVKFNSKVAT